MAVRGHSFSAEANANKSTTRQARGKPIMSNTEPTTADNLTLPYWLVSDSTENVRGERFGSGDTDDGASVETNARSTSRTSSMEGELIFLTASGQSNSSAHSTPERGSAQQEETTSNAEPPTAGNFTLDDYLQMVDDAEASARGARFDGASVETNASAASRASCSDADAASKKKNDAAPSLSGMGIDQLLDIFTCLSIKDRTRVAITCKHMLSQQTVCDKSVRSLCVAADKVGKDLLANRVEDATRVLLGQRSAFNILHRSRQLQWTRLCSLRELNVEKHCTDYFLEMIGCKRWSSRQQ